MSEKTDKTQLSAVALRYDNTKEAAPRVVAKGNQMVAERIIEIAEEYGIPIHRDADLVNILNTIELDQEIPLEVYSVVAEVFAYIYRMNQKKAAQ